LSEGALEVKPPEARDNGLDLLLSAGIHGNETAPIELLDRLLHDIARGDLKPRARVLFLFGNPEAIRRGERFVEQDVNRLFNGRHELSGGPEALRACELERLAASFFSVPDRSRLHYDLHTAIRGSKIEQFALYPWKEGRQHSRRELARLRAAGMEAVLLQNKPSIVFSAYTYGLAPSPSPWNWARPGHLARTTASMSACWKPVCTRSSKATSRRRKAAWTVCNCSAWRGKSSSTATASA
jgi:succinylglutamate desuccinylase